MAGFSSSFSAGRTKMHECSQCWHTYRFPNPYCPSPRFTSYEVKLSFPQLEMKGNKSCLNTFLHTQQSFRGNF